MCQRFLHENKHSIKASKAGHQVFDIAINFRHFLYYQDLFCLSKDKIDANIRFNPAQNIVSRNFLQLHVV